MKLLEQEQEESRVRYDEAKDQVIYSSGKRPHPGVRLKARVRDSKSGSMDGISPVVLECVHSQV